MITIMLRVRKSIILIAIKIYGISLELLVELITIVIERSLSPYYLHNTSWMHMIQYCGVQLEVCVFEYGWTIRL